MFYISTFIHVYIHTYIYIKYMLNVYTHNIYGYTFNNYSIHI